MSRLENIQNSFKSIQAKTKAFFHGDRWKEVLVFFFFALLAFGFWLLQSLQQEYEIELVFPVKYKNVPADIAFNAPEVETITAKVKDKGSVLLNYTFGRSFAPIEVNMKNTKEKNGSVQVSKRQIENDIQKQLIATTALQSFDPQQIDMDFSQRVHKEIPVVFNGDIHQEAGGRSLHLITVLHPHAGGHHRQHTHKNHQIQQNGHLQEKRPGGQC